MGRKHYRVYLANPEMSEQDVYRTFWDRLFALDVPAFLTFRRENGQKTRINKHWIIKIDTV